MTRCPLVCPPGRNHWPDRRNHLFSLEATGYALLALVRLNRMTEAEVLFKWLNSQRKRGGAFGSTQVLRRTTCQSSESKARLSVSALPSSFLLFQSTMVVLHALSEYLIHQPPAPDQSLNVDVRISGRTDIRYHFSPQSSFVARSTRVRERCLLFRTSGRLQTDVLI